MNFKKLKIGNLCLKVPIFQGGMGVGVSGYKLASAVANAGGVGVLSAAQIGYKEKDFKTNNTEANLRALIKEIKKARNATKGLLGVNIMVAMKNYEELCRTAAKEGIDFIISGAGIPTELPEYIKGSKTKIVPIVSSVRLVKILIKKWSKKFERLPDAIVIEGPKAGGHLGFSKEELIKETAKSVYEITKEVKTFLNEKGYTIPIITAGGIDSSSEVKKAFDAGADAIQVATRFVTTNECDADIAYKNAYKDAKEEDIVITQSPVGMPGRAIKNKMLEKIESGQRIKPEACYQCVKHCNPATTPYCITDALIRAVEGDVENGLVFIGANGYKANKIESVEEVIEDLFEI